MATFKESLGVKFPIELVDGGVKLATENDTIAAAINNLLHWPRFTRGFEREFGSDIYLLLDEPNDAVASALAVDYIKNAMNLYEPRVQVLEVVAIRSNIHQLDINVIGLIKTSGKVFDFALSLNN